MNQKPYAVHKILAFFTKTNHHEVRFQVRQGDAHVGTFLTQAAADRYIIERTKPTQEHRAEIEPYLIDCMTDRSIDIRDGSVLPRLDNGYRYITT